MKKDVVVQNLVDGYGDWVQGESSTCKCGLAKMTKDLYPYDNIFSPITVNRTVIKNRIVMGPMGNLMMCEETGRPSSKMLEYFFARAKGGVGLITTGLIPVSHGIDPTVSELDHKTMFPVLDSKARTSFMGWRDLAQGCHAYGSKIFVQLTPGLGRVGPPSCLLNSYKFPRSASFNPNFYTPKLPCLRLSGHSLSKIINRMGQATADAHECGLDGVYLHGHEGYLLEQMTNTAFNRRSFGKYADWQRFGIDCVEEMRRRGGSDYPIMYRIDLSLALNETYGDNMKKVKSLKKFSNGRTIAETLEYMANLVKAGVDMFDVDLGCYDNWWLPHPPAGMPAGCFTDISKIAKEYFAEHKILSNAGREVPIVAVGKLGYPDLAEKSIRDGKCDMVMLARPLLSDPEWANKAYAGDVDEIIPCIGCQEGCVNEFVEGGHPQCAVNARTGNEDRIPDILPEAKVKKNICVVGAGPAGVTFALTAHERGHKVTMFEKTDHIGGKVVPGAAPKIKFDFDNYLQYLVGQVEKASAKKDFKIEYNTAVTVESLADKGYDSIVIACGAKDMCPRFPGLDKIKHVQAIDLLVDPSLADGSNKVVVVGGGVVGCETAYWLSYELGKKVEVVEMMQDFMSGVCTANRGHLLHYMNKAGIPLHNGSKVEGFDTGKVLIKKNVSKHIPDPYITWTPLLPHNIENPVAPYTTWKPFHPSNKDIPKFAKADKSVLDVQLDADLVVVALGGGADDKLYYDVVKANIAKEVFNIGDSHKAGRVLEANRSAFSLARKI